MKNLSQNLKLKLDNSFSYLNIVQFLGAFNDNYFKLIMVYLLIGKLGADDSSMILSIAGAVFVLPYILFSMPSGILADRLSKSSIIVATKILEMGTMCLAMVMIWLEIPWGLYLTLFLLGTQSAIFSPSKYGIIPEIVNIQKMSRANGLLNLMTFLAIIIGTYLASLLTDFTDRNFILIATIGFLAAIFGLLASLKIEKTEAKQSEKRIHLFFFYDVYRALKISKSKQYLRTSIYASAFFWYIGAFVQLNIIPFAITNLHLPDVFGGYLFLFTAIGIGGGSILSGILSGKSVEIGLVVWGSIGIFINLLLLGFFPYNVWISIIFMIGIGFSAGFFIVPIDTYIQYASPVHDRGLIIASGNLLSFVAILLASGTLIFFNSVLNITPAQGFIIVGILSLFVTIIIGIFLFEKFLRLFVNSFTRSIIKIHCSEKYSERERSHTLFICSYPYWKKLCFLMTTSPKMIFLIETPDPALHRYQKLLAYAKIYFINPNTDLVEIQKQWQYALNLGRSICLFVKDIQNKHLQNTSFISIMVEKGREINNEQELCRKPEYFIGLEPHIK